jgi:hypothetical protein
LKVKAGQNFIKFRVYLDHAVVMRKGGYPIAVNNLNSINDLDDIKKPPESEM